MKPPLASIIVIALVIGGCDAADAGRPCETGSDCERNCISAARQLGQVGDKVACAYCQGDDNVPICCHVIDGGKVKETYCT